MMPFQNTEEKEKYLKIIEEYDRYGKQRNENRDFNLRLGDTTKEETRIKNRWEVTKT